MVKCESCKILLGDSNLADLIDRHKKTHLICIHCKKLAELILKTFDELDWNAFLEFAARHNEEKHEKKAGSIPIAN
ncbi:MAG TPA: hypothetical protein VJH22_05135 [Candidatus Nanoarchaeia archaeon]|nr:hypothetical protein [Candidatus Nanoarchaeia archaeon]